MPTVDGVCLRMMCEKVWPGGDPALGVSCPSCRAPRGEMCTKPRRGRFHGARVQRAEDKGLYGECPSGLCGPGVGDRVTGDQLVAPRVVSPESDEMVEGYMDGLDPNSPAPSGNRSASYRHGFLNGRGDRHGHPRAPPRVLRVSAHQAVMKDRAQRDLALPPSGPHSPPDSSGT